MRQWVNDERTVLVVERDDGALTVALRPDVDATWGPPIAVLPDPTVELWKRHGG